MGLGDCYPGKASMVDMFGNRISNVNLINAQEQAIQQAMRQKMAMQDANNREITMTATMKLASAIEQVRGYLAEIAAREACGIPIDKNLTEAKDKAIAAAKAAYREQREQELAVAKKQLEELKSREQKREDVLARIAKLEEELG